MRKIIILGFGLLMTMTGFAQNNVKVQIFPSKIISRTLIVIPEGDKYIYEDYTYFKYVYWLNHRDTLELINDSVMASESLRISLDLYTTEYDFCDSKINKIRNSSLTHRLLHSMINDSCSKYIGWDNNEFKYFQRDLAFEEGFEEKICSDRFPVIAYERFDSLYNKIQEIYQRKEHRTEWIKKNHAKIDKDYINSFLIDFNYNEPDKEAFIQILIANPNTLIQEIDKLEEPYLIIWKVKEIKNIDGILEAIERLEKTDLKSKTKRQILNNLKKNVT